MISNTVQARLNQPRTAASALGATTLLAGAISLLLAAPALMPASYDWLRHTTSESAAQGVPNAWLARLGFLCFGFAVLWLSAQMRACWPPAIRVLLGAFGVLMVATAAFSTRPWLPDAAFDPVEDTLHSVTATGLGLLFPTALTLRAIRRRDDRLGLLLDALGVGLSLAMPLAMLSGFAWLGLLQRVMFAAACIWFVAERLRAPTTVPTPQATAPQESH